MKRRKNLKEQAISASKPKGLPAPAELAAKINAAGMGATEVMAWLGAVLSKAGMGASPDVPEAPPVAELPPPPPTPEAVKENLENRLLDDLLRDVKNSRRKR